MQENDGKSVSGNQGSSPVEAGNLQQRRLTRRTLIRHGLIAGGALIAATYVKPDLQSIRIPRAFAAGTEFTPEGCTPGLWKNKTSLWHGYSPDDDFDTVFGVDAFTPNLTLLKVLEQGGGGIKAFGRHAVAALLNAAHPNVDYPLTTAEVIGLVQTALAPGGDIEGTKNQFELRNEASCNFAEGESLRADP